MPTPSTTTLDIDSLRAWIGRQEIRQDQATIVPLQALSATLDHEESWACGDPIPPLWHWLYFLPLHRQSAIGPDGHALRGGFLPPVPLPRRMWAGSQFRFLAPLRAGDALQRTSTIVDVKLKQGRSGPLVFVKVRHDIQVQGQAVIEEFHDIVYRGLPAADEPPPQPQPAPAGAPWSRTIVPDDVLLFRYSALTFNGHRIHYDRRYVTQVEGYLGLIVHGPLVATLLLDLLRRHEPGARVQGFEFRAVNPLFDVAPFEVCGCPRADGTVDLWAVTPDGHLAMQATATLA